MSYQTTTTLAPPSQELSLHSNAFTDKMLAQLRNESEHISSPLSIYTLLVLTALGSTRETFMELFKLLTKEDKQLDTGLMVELSDGLYNLMNHFKRNSTNDNVIEIVNNFYVRAEYDSSIKNRFKYLMNNFGRLESLDFSKPEMVANQVNTFVDNKTRGLIPKLISPENINANTIMMLVNVIYFKCKWSQPFEVANTTPNTAFTTLQNSIRPVEMMSQTDNFKYNEDAYFQVITLPYKNGLFAMDIVLPRTSASESEINKINYYNMRYLIDTAFSRECHLYLPKFKQRFRMGDLVDRLKEMGIQRLFDSGCQLDNISDVELFVSQIIHEAIIIVDESGTEAAAATIMFMEELCCDINEPEPVTFRADHTFRYFIRYIPNNLVLFTGQYDGQNTQ